MAEGPAEYQINHLELRLTLDRVEERLARVEEKLDRAMTLARRAVALAEIAVDGR